MRVILDTNVLVSGIFFSGPPFQILNAWRNKEIQLVISTDILAEYQRVAIILGAKYSQIGSTSKVAVMRLTVNGKLY